MTSSPRRARVTGAALAGCLLVVAGCSGGEQEDPVARQAAGSPSPSGSSSPSADPDADPSQESAPSAPSTRATATGWGPSARELRTARRITGRMTLRKLAGQVIVARYAGRKAPVGLVNGLHLGGVIVFDDNIGDNRRLRTSNRRLQRAAKADGRRWPVFVGVDQEGGIVERVKGSATRFPAFMTAGATREPRLTRRAAAASGAELRNLGFSVVFAPDGDVTTGPSDPTIGSRSAGSRPALVGRQVNAAVDGYLSAGVLPVIKHFPGHGSVPADSHLELPVQDRSLRQLRATDLKPFAAGVEGEVSSVMVGHIAVRAVDAGIPSSLSRKVVTRLLRRDLGFDGLVVTDALDMAAITDRWSSSESAVRALRAGSDVLLMPPDPRAARDGIVAAVRSGALRRGRLEQAAARQIALLRHQRDLEPSLSRRPGTSKRDSYRLSAAGVTVVDGPCRGRLVGSSVSVTGPAGAVARFRGAARRAGLGTGGGTRVALVGYGGGAVSGDVVVSLDTPYVLGSSSATRARIALYGDTPGAMRALVDVLLGKARAPGRLPVRVPGVPRTGC